MNPQEYVAKLESLAKSLEAGMPSGAPDTLTQGAALGVEDLSDKMRVTTFEQKHLALQKEIDITPVKSLLAQFNRQLSYGQFGGGAQPEGNLGPESTGEYNRVTVPMCFYSKLRRVSMASTMIKAFDGVQSDEREAKNAAIELAADFEFDCMRGMDDYSNAGVFDGNPFQIAPLANMHGAFLQIRQSDFQAQAKDRMFSEFGSDATVVLSVGGNLTQERVEDASTRSVLAFGDAKALWVDPVVLSNYNKITIGKERYVLAGSPAEATGSTLKRQWVSSGTVDISPSNFLRGKTTVPGTPRNGTPGAPTISLAANSGAGANIPAGTQGYFVSAGNEYGEGRGSALSTQAVNAGDSVSVTITPSGSGNAARFFAVYRGASLATAAYIGKVANSGNSTTVFTDLGNKLPAFSTGILLDKQTLDFGQLCPYSKMKLAQTDLTLPEAHFDFRTLRVFMPRFNVLLDNLNGKPVT